MRGIVSVRVCALFRYLFNCLLQFVCISCYLGFLDRPIICYRVRGCFRNVVSSILLPVFDYLITCSAVLFNRVRLGRVVDFTGLPVYWFTGFINLSVVLCCVRIIIVFSMFVLSDFIALVVCRLFSSCVYLSGPVFC